MHTVLYLLASIGQAMAIAVLAAAFIACMLFPWLMMLSRDGGLFPDAESANSHTATPP